MIDENKVTGVGSVIRRRGKGDEIVMSGFQPCEWWLLNKSVQRDS